VSDLEVSACGTETKTYHIFVHAITRCYQNNWKSFIFLEEVFYLINEGVDNSTVFSAIFNSAQYLKYVHHNRLKQNSFRSMNMDTPQNIQGFRYNFKDSRKVKKYLNFNTNLYYHGHLLSHTRARAHAHTRTHTHTHTHTQNCTIKLLLYAKFSPYSGQSFTTLSLMNRRRGRWHPMYHYQLKHQHACNCFSHPVHDMVPITTSNCYH